MKTPKIHPSCKPQDWSIKIATRQPHWWGKGKIQIENKASLWERLKDAIKTAKENIKRRS